MSCPTSKPEACLELKRHRNLRVERMLCDNRRILMTAVVEHEIHPYYHGPNMPPAWFTGHGPHSRLVKTKSIKFRTT